MPVCCRCNGSGRCRNCSCSKAGKPCVDCPQRKGRCCNESHTSSQTPTQPSSQTTPQASNIPSLGSACVGNQDTQPPTQPSPDNEMAHETSDQRSTVNDQRSVVDNSGMSSLTDNNGMLGAGPEQQDQPTKTTQAVAQGRYPIPLRRRAMYSETSPYITETIR